MSLEVLKDLRLLLGQTRRSWGEYLGVRREVLGARRGRTILVTGTYRSGTTWIGAMLTAPGVWHVHEPFNPNRGLWDRELTYAAPDAPHPGIDRFVDRLERGDHSEVVRFSYADRWFSPIRLLPLRPRRVLIKDPSAALMSSYLASRPNMEVLVVFRHPAGVVGSFRRLGWPTDRMCARLLEDRELMEARLERFAPLIEEAARNRGLFSGTVFYGSINRILWEFLEERPESMRSVSFENLCGDPLERFRDLYDGLDLRYDDKVLELHRRLSLSNPEEAGEYPPHEVRRSSAAMAERWRSEMTSRELVEIRSIWERFEVPLYRSTTEW